MLHSSLRSDVTQDTLRGISLDLITSDQLCLSGQDRSLSAQADSVSCSTAWQPNAHTAVCAYPPWAWPCSSCDCVDYAVLKTASLTSGAELQFWSVNDAGVSPHWNLSKAFDTGKINAAPPVLVSIRQKFALTVLRRRNLVVCRDTLESHMNANLFTVLFAVIVIGLTFAPRIWILGAVIIIPLTALAIFSFQEFATPNRKHRPRGPKYTVPQ